MFASNEPFLHICEVCGKTQELTAEAAFNAGWDYPPKMGAFAVVSTRICDDCPMTKTLWWRLTQNPGTYKATPEDLILVERIAGEPETLRINTTKEQE